MLRLFLHMQRAFWSTVFARLIGRSPRQDWEFIVDVVTKLLWLDGQYLAKLPPPRLRAEYELRVQKTPVMRSVTVTMRALGGVQCAVVEPAARDGNRTLLYLHGGAYIFGSHRTHADVLARMATGCRARVIAPEYRQAPEHPYPAQLDDARAVYRALLGEVRPGELLVGGESAGGNLALALLMALRDSGEPLPACALLMSAWVDLTSARPSMLENARYDWGDAEMLRTWARQFSGAVALGDARVSPLSGKLDGLPPLYVLVGRHEVLHDENVELAQKVRDAGGQVELAVIPKLPHAPIFFAPWSKAAREAVGTMAEWARSRTG